MLGHALPPQTLVRVFSPVHCRPGFCANRDQQLRSRTHRMFLPNVVMGGLPTDLRTQSTSDESPPSGVGARCSFRPHGGSEPPTSRDCSVHEARAVLRPPCAGDDAAALSAEQPSRAGAERGPRGRSRTNPVMPAQALPPPEPRQCRQRDAGERVPKGRATYAMRLASTG